MVVFTCNHCGDSLQKPKVEKHYQIVCRQAKSLTCVDCLKDFSEEYASHTKCITEEERYAAKNGNSKPIVKKGEVKQESWTKLITDVVNSAGNVSSGQKRILDILESSVNVPRKKIKFTNFIKSSSGSRVKDDDIETIWNMIEQFKTTACKENGAEQLQPQEHKIDDASGDPAPKKKRKSKDIQPNDSEGATNAELEVTTVVPKKQKKIHDSENAPKLEETPELVTKKKRKSKGNEKQQVEPENVLEPLENNDVVPKKQRKSKGIEEDIPNLPEPTNEIVSKKKRKAKDHVEPIIPENCVESAGDSTEQPKQKKHKTKNGLNGTETKPETDDSLNKSEQLSFTWKQAILNILASKDAISLEKLQKKVLKAHEQVDGPTNAKSIKKFKKTLKKMTDVEVKDNHVRLINKA